MDAAHMQATRTMFPSDCMHDMLWSNEMVNDGDCISQVVVVVVVVAISLQT